MPQEHYRYSLTLWKYDCCSLILLEHNTGFLMLCEQDGYSLIIIHVVDVL